MSKHFRFPGSAAQLQISATGKSMTKLAALGPLVLALFCMPVGSLLAQTPTPVTVPTWRYDLTHSGKNTNETALSPANVNVNSFGRLFALAVDSTVYAQPLYVPGLTMSDGQVHNVLFVATENDSIYAFDADSNGGSNATYIWKISLLTTAHGAGAGATAVPWKDTGSPDVAPTIGITGTPTIDPATNTMYVVAATKENGVYFSRLHAINILTGAEQTNSPVAITATVAGTGNGSSGGQLSFSPLWENQRPALNYYNGYVYIGYAAHGDNGPWHGWLFAYNATSLAQSAAICLSPNGYGAGIWSSGAGMPIDEEGPGGRMFVATGNGTYSTYPPFNGSTELGESVVDFSLADGGLQATDAFTAFNKDRLNSGDLDLGAGGLLMPPDQQAEFPHMLVVAGKEGRIVVLNRDNLGGYSPGGTSNTNALQDIMGQIKGCWCTPAYYLGNVYIWAQNDVPKMFQLSDGLMTTQPSSQSTIISAFPSPSFSISSNDTQDGIAWAVRSDQFNTHGALVLYAWDATDLTKTIYESDTNSTRDAGGAANRYSIPVVTNGKVYVAANGQVDVYGLFNGEPNAAAPVITPNGGTFSTSQSVKLSTTTASANIYYTLDGSAPTPASTLYAGPITISTDTTLNAIASATGFVQSGVSSATFSFSVQTPPVSFLPAGGTYSAAQHVAISDTDTNAKIYYTTDGSTPSASSTLYSGPIQVSISETINAVAIDPALQNSNVGTSAYVIQGGSSIDFGSGFSSTAGLTLNGSAVATNDTRLQLTNGGGGEAGSVFWNTPINIQAFTTSFEFQLSSAQGNGFTFTIQNVGPTALGGNSTGLGYQGIGQSVAIKFNFYDYNGEGSDSTGVYTDGAPPTLPTVDLTPSGIQLNSGDSIQAQVTYDGTTLTLNLLDLVTNDKFTMSQAINIPQIVGANTAYVGFTGGTGGLTSSQKLLTWTYATQSVSCSAPTSPGVHICLPASGSTVNSPVQVTAAAMVTGTLAQMQLWVDGVKKYTAPSSGVLNTSISVAAGTHRFAVLALNTAGQVVQSAVNATVGTAGGGGGCTAPASPGVDICLPVSGSSVNSPVQVTAAATVTGTISQMQLWVDGVKQYTAPSSSMLNTSISLAAGGHRFAVLALNTTGQTVQSAVNATVGTVGGGGGCTAPTSPGVQICLPASGSTVNSPVQVQAAATVTGTIAQMQLWVDGVKKYAVLSSGVLNTSISLAAGSHRFAVLAINTTGQMLESVSNATVQ